MASGLAAAQGFSRSGAPRDSEVANAASEPSAPQHLRLGTASACRALTPAEPLCPLRSLGKGGDTKKTRAAANQMPVSRGGGGTPPSGAWGSANRHREVPGDFWEL